MTAPRIDGDRRIGTTFAPGETVRVTINGGGTATIESVEPWGYLAVDQYGRRRALFHFQIGKVRT